MPVLSMFYGVIISMFYKDHNPPHIHIQYAEYKAIVDFNGDILEGELPSKQRKLIEAWIVLHQDELYANWQLAKDKQGLFKIDPLK
ncbi:DUF4160 domain-containing protein [Treponema sp. OMZ 305]|uniref:DUF4160 domain-containing protein n=1 Tax=unclassified Treponema TaxID=2638727 RepID=UPI0020A57292|nr:MULTISPECIES: DUF4160 domain-containing protein [unclassified Treponema]UTC52377.1 DUF4160 domain-containing protein [Treponema sp. OMZ 803]UTC58287.1 DUF4160 domain-containing protein [Treponema sp. OMZ 305]